MLNDKTIDFRDRLMKLDRDELLSIIADQDPEYIKQINRIEYVFANKLGHLTWNDGMPIKGRPLTKEELILLIDEPFVVDKDLTEMGLSITQQRELHVAKDIVTWSKTFLGVEPRVYQTLILRHPSLRKVLRAGRRLGKTVSMSLLLLHYSYTNKNAKSIVIAPMKAQVEVIYKEVYQKELKGGSADIFPKTYSLSKEQLEVGDLVFFKIRKSRISHVGIYLGNNKFVHAAVKGGVRIDSLEAPYYKKTFYRGGRL